MLAVTSAILAGVFGASGVGNAQQLAECTGPTTAYYKYCSDHVPASKLPLRLSYNPAGAPSSLIDGGGHDTTPRAIRAAADAWDMFWPFDGSACAPLCYMGTTGAPFGFDHVSSIVWDSPSRCGGSASDVAIACLWYAGTSGASAHRIVEVDVILNPAVSWANPAPGDPEALAGDVVGLDPVDVPQLHLAVNGMELNPFYGAWNDVQSALTHEFGHAFGLEHIGAASRFPNNLADAPIYTETMYRWAYAGTTNKRTPEAGDVAAELRAAAASYADTSS
jgi:hypothetical protein